MYRTAGIRESFMVSTNVFSKDLFRGKAVFITGGGSGINLGIAKHFAALGANLGICGRTQEKLDAAAEELRALGAEVVTQTCDVRDYDGLKSAIDAAAEAFGSIDVLVCGAAGNFPCPAEALIKRRQTCRSRRRRYGLTPRLPDERPPRGFLIRAGGAPSASQGCDPVPLSE